MYPPFAVDKNKSLDIMHKIISHFQDEPKKQVCMRKDVKWSLKHSSNKGRSSVIKYKHKLNIIEVDLGPPYNDTSDIDNKEAEKQFYRSIDDDDLEKSKVIEIYNGSQVINDKISLIGFFYDTIDDDDVLEALFVYDDMYKCWIRKDKNCCCEKGIETNGIVTILDFSDYKL